MIAEAIVGTILLGAGVSGWIAAYRARGQANDAGDRARLAEAKADAAVKGREIAEANEAAARSEMRVLQVTLAEARQTITRKTKEHNDDLEAIAEAGIPVGDVLVDNALDDLYPDADGDGREAGAGDGGEGAGPLSDDTGDPAGGTDPRG